MLDDPVAARRARKKGCASHARSSNCRLARRICYATFQQLLRERSFALPARALPDTLARGLPLRAPYPAPFSPPLRLPPSRSLFLPRRSPSPSPPPHPAWADGLLEGSSWQNAELPAQAMEGALRRLQWLVLRRSAMAALAPTVASAVWQLWRWCCGATSETDPATQ